MRLWTAQPTNYTHAVWHPASGEIRLVNKSRDCAMTLTLDEAIAQHAALGRAIEHAAREPAREAA